MMYIFIFMCFTSPERDWMLYFQNISFQIIYRSKQLQLYRVVASKVCPYINIVLLFLHFLVLWGSTSLFGNTVALSPRLGGARDVASVIISHEPTQSYQACCFLTSDALFPEDPLSDYLECYKSLLLFYGMSVVFIIWIEL